jgi:hypothetical protein
MRRLDFSMKIQTAILTESASDIECAKAPAQIKTATMRLLFD